MKEILFMKAKLPLGITWAPRGLEQMISSPWAERRFRNKSGYALIYDPEGFLAAGLEGPIINVSRAAQSYWESCPRRDIAIMVVENVCGSQSPFSPSQYEPDPEIPGYLSVRWLIF